MSLIKDSYLLPEEFEILNNRVMAESYRRSKGIEGYGNIHNNNAFTSSTLPITQNGEHLKYFPKEIMNGILGFLSNFKQFPGEELLDISYYDGYVEYGDIIFAIENAKEILNQIESTNRVSNKDCNNGCMGLCTNSCDDGCTSCTGCTSCSGCTGCSGCSGGCSGCSGGCTGCTASGCNTFGTSWNTPTYIGINK